MELYVTKNSPYARIVRAVTYQLGIENDIVVIAAKTRSPDSPYYNINPSGRVPYLITDDGTGIEGTDTISAYLCELSDSALWSYPDGEDGWALRRLHSNALSTLEGLSVWLRETHRPVNEQSPGIIEHERARAFRILEAWETLVTTPQMLGNLNCAQVTLYCALGTEKFLPDFQWRGRYPNVDAFMTRLTRYRCFTQTEETNF